MNGRCDNDPLDPADDVCDLCGGEFCETCMVERTKRTRQTVCLECSLIQARVRPGKIIRVRSRREAKKRRKEIQNERHSMQDEGRFVFFDNDEEKVSESEPTSTKKTLSGRKSTESPQPAGKQNPNEPDSDPESWVSQIDELIEPDAPELPPEEEFAVPLSPAVEKLEQLRLEGPDESAPPAALRPKPSAPGPMALTDADSTDFNAIDPFATSLPPTGPTTQQSTKQTVPAPVPASLKGVPEPVPAALTEVPAALASKPVEVEPVPAALMASATVPAVLAGVSASAEPSQAAGIDIDVPDVFKVKSPTDTAATEPDFEDIENAESAEEWVPPILRG